MAAERRDRSRESEQSLSDASLLCRTAGTERVVPSGSSLQRRASASESEADRVSIQIGAGAVGAAPCVSSRLRSRGPGPSGAPVSAGRSTTIALCAVGALFLSACAGEPSCVEDRTCPASATGGEPGDAATGGGNGGGSGSSGTGGTSGGGASGRGGTEGGAGTGSAHDAGDAGREAEAGPVCNAGLGQVTEGCPIEDPEGIFVSRMGEASTGDGSRAHPFTTITAAIEAATAVGDGGAGGSGAPDGGAGDGGAAIKKRIYVCADGGAYAETITIDATKNAARDGLAFLGGFRCADWKYDPATRTKLASPGLTAWTVSGVVKGVSIEDFDISSVDATASRTSSIAMIVNQASKNVHLSRVKITAGKGSDGARGVDGSDGAPGFVAGPNEDGRPAVCVNPPTSNYPGYWTSTGLYPYGGSGGAGWLNMNGERGVYGGFRTNVTPPNVDNGGMGATTLGVNGGKGGDGSRGNDGPSADNLAAPDEFISLGYSAGLALSGGDGYAGQGGGGGGSSKGSTTCTAPSGGAGGVGGGAGKHGTGGASGGASVGLYVLNSEVILTNVTLVSGNGGAGGDGGSGGSGGKGQPGGKGGQGDVANGIGSSGDGGKGGDGGNGGSGAGGNGGPSFPLVFKGAAPTKIGVVYTPGQPGLPGAGGFNGVTRAPNGTQGEAAAEHEIP